MDRWPLCLVHSCHWAPWPSLRLELLISGSLALLLLGLFFRFGAWERAHGKVLFVCFDHLCTCLTCHPSLMPEMKQLKFRIIQQIGRFLAGPGGLFTYGPHITLFSPVSSPLSLKLLQNKMESLLFPRVSPEAGPSWAPGCCVLSKAVGSDSAEPGLLHPSTFCSQPPKPR